MWSAADGPLLARIDARTRPGSIALTSLQERLGDHAYVLVDGPRLVVELRAPITGGRSDVDLLADRIAEAVAELRRLPDELDSIGYVGWNAGADAGLLAAAELSTDVAAVVAVRSRLRLVLPRLSSVAAPTLLIADTRDSWLLGRRALRRLPSESALVRRSTTSEADVRAVELIAAAWIERFTGSSPGSPAPERRHLNRRMRRRLAKLAPAAVLAAGAIAATGSSAASGTCTPSFDSEQGVLTITCDGDGAAFTLSHLGGEILLDGTPTEAKLEGTKLVSVFTTDGADQVKIDESNGPFLLPFEVEFKDGKDDQLTYLGQKSEANSLLLELDTVKLGDLGTIKLSGADLVEIKLGDANDLVDASKWELTDLKLYGEGGDDTLLAGQKVDLLSGGPGLNKLVGGEGTDLVLEEITFAYDATSFKLETTPGGSFFRSVEGKQETESKMELIESAEFKFLDEVDYKLDAAEWELSELKLYGGPGDDTFVSGHKVGLLDAGDGFDLLTEELSFAKFGATDYKLLTTNDGSFLKELDGSKLEVKIAGVESAEFKFLDEVDYKLDAAEWELSELKLYGGRGDDTFVSGHKVGLLDAGDGFDLLTEELSFAKFGATDYKLLTTNDGSFLKELDGSKLEVKIAGVESAEFKFLDEVDYKLDAAEWELSELKLYGGPGDDTFVSGHKVGLLDAGDGFDLLTEELSFAKFGATDYKLLTTNDGSFLKELDGSKLEVKIAGVESAEFKFLDEVDYKLDAAEWELSELKLYGGPGDDAFVSGFKVGLLDGGDGTDLLREDLTASKFFGATDYKLLTTTDGSFLKTLDGTQALESKMELIESAEFKFLDDVDYKLDVGEWKLADLKVYGGPGDDAFVGGFKLSLADGGDGVDSLDETLSSALFGTTSFALSDTYLKVGTTTLTQFSAFETLGFKFADAAGYKLDASAFSQAIKLEGGDGPDTFVGSKFADFLLGNGGADSVNGGPGNDKIGGGRGSDKLVGATGIDTLVEVGDVSFKLTDTLLTGLGQDALSGFEAASLTGGANDNVLDASSFKAGAVTLFGLGADDVLLATGFADLLYGGDGDDDLAAKGGNDKLFGELGDDALDGGAGTDFGDAGPGNNTCKSIEQAVNC